MPGYEIWNDQEKKHVQEVLETGILMRYNFDAQRKGIWKTLSFEQAIQQKLNVVGLIPGLMTMEKEGSYINESQLKQTVSATIQTVGHCLTVNKVIEALWIK